MSSLHIDRDLYKITLYISKISTDIYVSASILNRNTNSIEYDVQIIDEFNWCVKMYKVIICSYRLYQHVGVIGKSGISCLYVPSVVIRKDGSLYVGCGSYYMNTIIPAYKMVIC